jgi:DNA (cytosine-5)-methyltransferase 1
LASHLIGWDTVCAVEIDGHCQRVLAQRQRDGMLPTFPIWDDIRTFDGKPWNGCVDVISGGFPCQDISSAGRGAGLSGDRSGLWFEMLRVIGEVRPAYVFAENSPMLRTRGLDVVLEGLTALGFDAAWGVLGANHVGGPHRRDRVWIVAADAAESRPPTWDQQDGAGSAGLVGEPWHGEDPKLAAARLLGMGDGMADRMGRIKAAGNGQVPAVAALAWRVLSNTLEFAQSGGLP